MQYLYIFLIISLLSPLYSIANYFDEVSQGIFGILIGVGSVVIILLLFVVMTLILIDRLRHETKYKYLILLFLVLLPLNSINISLEFKISPSQAVSSYFEEFLKYGLLILP
jgi:uncharacterized membrane protein YhaH (DUF805 family)